MSSSNYILILPSEILFKIFLHIPNLAQSNYRLVSKTFDEVILEMFHHYDKVYSALVPDWEHNIKKLIKILIKTDNKDGLLFFINNYILPRVREGSFSYPTQELDFYIGFYNRKDLLKYGGYHEWALINGAARGGHLEFLKYLIKRYGNYTEGIVANAALGGHLDIIKLFIDDFEPESIYNIGINGAVKGHMHIVEYAIKKGFNYFHDLANYAARGGRLDIVKFAVSKGAKDFNAIARNAAENDKINVMEYAIEHGANDFQRMLIDAVKRKAMKATKYIIKTKKYTDLDEVVKRAISFRAIKILKYIVKHGYNNFTNIALYASRYGDLDLLKYAIRHGAVISAALVENAKNDEIRIYLMKKDKKLANVVALYAASANKLDLMKLAIKEGANNYKSMGFEATKKGNLNIVKYLLTNAFITGNYQ